MIRKLHFYLVLGLSFFFSIVVNPALALDVIRVTPEGEEVSAYQSEITVKFDTEVVPFGYGQDNKIDIGIKITPEIDCEQRWTAPNLWTCQRYYTDKDGTWHSAAMKNATQYQITIPKDIKALDGSTLKETVVKNFETTRPKIYSATYNDLSPVYGYWKIETNQKVDIKSLNFVINIDNSYISTKVKRKKNNYGNYYLVYPRDKLPYKKSLQLIQMGEIKSLEGPLPGKKNFSSNIVSENFRSGYILDVTQSNWFSPTQPSFNIKLRNNIIQSSLHFTYRVGNKKYRAKIKDFEKKMCKSFDGWRKRDCQNNTNQYKQIIANEPMLLDSDGTLFLDEGAITDTGDIIPEIKIKDFHTFSDFKFLGWSCGGGNFEKEGYCHSEDGLKLQFSAPLSKGTQEHSFKFTNSLKKKKTNRSRYLFIGKCDNYVYNLAIPESEKYCYGTNNFVDQNINYASYEIYSLYPGQKNLVLESTNIQDIFGRKLKENPIIKFGTFDYRKKSYFHHNTTVLEKNETSEVPIFGTNHKSQEITYRTITTDGRSKEINKNLQLPYIHNQEDFVAPLHIRNLLDGKSGVLQGTLKKDESRYYDEKVFSQVTPFHVHVKLGRLQSLVWVTNFADGKPVENADVSIGFYNIKDFAEHYNIHSKARTNEQGVAIISGLDYFDKNKKYEYDNADENLVVLVKRDDNLAFLPLNYKFYTSNGYSSSYSLYSDSYLQAWGTTSQGVFKRGETIKYKFIVRDQDVNTLTIPERYNYTVIIKNPLGDEVFKKENITLSEFGTYSNEFTLGKNDYVGWYEIYLEHKTKGINGEPIKFLVSDFTPATYKIRASVDKAKYQVNDKAQLDVQATFYAGGPLAKGKLYVTANVYPRTISPNKKSYSEFDFSEKYLDKDNDLMSLSNDDEKLFQNSNFELDEAGLKQIEIPITPLKMSYGKILIESEVIDERGKSVATQSSATYIGRDQYLGIKRDSWLIYTKKNYTPEFVVIDGQGEIAKEAKISVVVEHQERKVVREKSAGDDYYARYNFEWHKVKECELDFIGQPLGCDFSPQKSGNYRVYGKIKDSKEREYLVGTSYYAFPSSKEDDEYVVTTEDESEPQKLDLTVVGKNYKVGDTAKILIKNPLPDSYALITRERYGVRTNEVKIFTSNNEIIEFPIEADDIPGFYVSVVVMSKRIAGAEFDYLDECNTSKYHHYCSGDFDTGKPKYYIGYAKIPVSGDDKELDIKVTPEKKEYRPAQKVKVDLEVLTKAKTGIKSEVAVIVLDESVYDLIQDAKNYFSPYKKFYSDFKDLAVLNFNNIEKLLGKIKFKKGLTPAGDGLPEQNSNLRKNFKYVAYWNPSLITDDKGKSTIEFDLPDNLTSWKVIAVAVDNKDKMGVGTGDFKAFLPIEVRPIMPNKILTNDKFVAKATVFNRSDKVQNVFINYQASGVVDDTKEHSVKARIEPFQRHLITLPLTVNKKGKITFIASATNKVDGDKVEVSMHAKESHDKATYVYYNELKADKEGTSKKLAMQYPENIYKGNFKITVTSSLIGSLEGVFRYMRDYPYSCWEQKTSRALVSAFYEVFKSSLPKSFKWTDGGKTFTQNILNKAKNNQAPNGGMAFYKPDDDYVSPYLSAYTAIAFNWLEELNLGFVIPNNVKEKLDKYLLNKLTYNNHLTTRILGVLALAKTGKVESKELVRLYNEKDKMNLFDKAFLLQAYLAFKDSNENEKEELLKNILNYSNETSGKLSFIERNTFKWWTLGSQKGTDCAVLMTFLKYLEQADDKQKKYIGDLPVKLARTIIAGLDKDGSWGNTHDNVMCTKALVDYRNIYEGTDTKYTFTSKIDSQEFSPLELRLDDTKESKIPLTPTDSGKKDTLEVTATGTGRAYYTATMSYLSATPLPPTNAGMTINREYSVRRGSTYQLLKEGETLNVGDYVRVDLYVNIPATRTYTVVEDPLPGALEPVNTDLATAARFDVKDTYPKESFYYTEKSWEESNYGFYFQELTNDAVRYYSDYLQAGNYHLRYLTQVVASGEFVSKAPYIEEMYNKDVFGRGERTKIKAE